MTPSSCWRTSSTTSPRDWTPRAATIKAMGEITGPIIAITLVLISVFLPAAFLPGIAGQFYRQFALTIASAMVISAVNAMTLTPSRAVTIFKTEQTGEGGHEMQREALPWWSFALFGGLATVWLGKPYIAALLGLPPADTPEHELAPKWLLYTATGLSFLPGALAGGVLGWLIIRPVNFVLGKFFRAFNWVFERVTALYGRTVGGLLRLSVIVLLLYGGLLFLTYRTMTTAPSGFIPEQDQGYLLVNVQLPDAASVQRTSEVMKKLERIVLGDDTGLYRGPAATRGEKRYEGIPGVADMLSIAGTSFLLSTNASHFGTAFVTLKPFADRKGKHEEYDAAVAARLSRLSGEEIDGAIVTVFRAPPIHGLGNAGGFKLQVEQRGFVDLAELQKSTNQVIAEARQATQPETKAPALVGVFTIYSAQTPQLYVDIDRTQCEKLGVDMQDVFDTLQVYMGTYYVNLFNKFGRTWQVNLSADQKYRTDERYLKLLKVSNTQGSMVPLGAVATVRPITGPVMVMRYNMYTSAPINGAPAPGVSSGQALRGHGGGGEKGQRERRVDRDRLPAAAAGQHGHPRVPAGDGAGLPGAGSPVRVVVAAAGDHPRRADVHPVRGHGHADRPHAGGHLRADRLPGAGGAGGQERHPDRRIRPPVAAGGEATPRGGRRGQPVASAADRHDVVRVHRGHGPAAARRGGGSGNAAAR